MFEFPTKVGEIHTAEIEDALRKKKYNVIFFLEMNRVLNVFSTDLQSCFSAASHWRYYGANLTSCDCL